MKRLISFFLVLCTMITCFSVGAWGSDVITEDQLATNSATLDVKAKSAILMEAATGKILYEQNANEALPPASVTKIMTLLMIMESLEAGKIKETDMVTISKYASSMGGSQVFLAEGEQFSVKDLLKCTIIASANDAAVSLAEFVFGSEKACVEAMNLRAQELGMTSTHFENVTGLDDTTQNHVTSALDIAIMSQRLIAYPLVVEYSSTWMDTIRDGSFTLNNTNRLVRFYPGATGLKTGSTAKAKFCLSATAERNGMTLIAVVMGADTRDTRNGEAMRMLDYGFANYALYTSPDLKMDDIYVTKGKKDILKVYYNRFEVVVEKGKKDKITYEIGIPSTVSAPIKKDDIIGTIAYVLEGVKIGESTIYAGESINAITFGNMFKKMLQTFLHPT